MDKIQCIYELGNVIQFIIQLHVHYAKKVKDI